MFSFLHSALMKCPHQETNLGRHDKDSAYCMATRCHLPPGTFCIVSVIAGQAGQQRWQGSRVQTPSRHFFFFRLDLPARPALSVILPWLCMQGPVA